MREYIKKYLIKKNLNKLEDKDTKLMLKLREIILCEVKTKFYYFFKVMLSNDDIPLQKKIDYIFNKDTIFNINYDEDLINVLCHLVDVKIDDLENKFKLDNNESLLNNLNIHIIKYIKKLDKKTYLKLIKEAIKNDRRVYKELKESKYEFDLELNKFTLSHYPFLIWDMEQSQELCDYAIDVFILKNENYMHGFLKKIDEKFRTYDMCKKIIQHDPLSLSYIPEEILDNELCILAIKGNTKVLNYIENQTEEMCEIAVKQDGRALEYVHNQTLKIVFNAIKENCEAIKFVRNPEILLLIRSCFLSKTYVEF